MPGVGVPAGWFWFFGALTSGMPGVGVPPGVIGEVWMPGGNGLELALAGAVFVLLAVWQPFKNKAAAKKNGKINLRGILNFLLIWQERIAINSFLNSESFRSLY